MTDLTTAQEEARRYAAHSYAQNTRQAYASDWKLFSAWCAEQQRHPLPATPETILGYIVALARDRSVATIDRRLCGIAFHHRQARLADPATDPEVLVTMCGLRRAKGIAPAAKTALTTAPLRQIVDVLADDLRGRRARALLLLGFAGAFRRSELVALQMADLAWVPEGLIVTVRRFKTDQEGAGMTKGIPCGSQEATCPVRALGAWLEAAAIKEGVVFRAFDTHGRLRDRPLPAYEVGRTVHWAVQQLGLTPKSYGGHSLRAGLVTEATKAGVSERVIMQQTGHSDMRTLRRYIRDGSLFRENAAAQVGL